MSEGPWGKERRDRSQLAPFLISNGIFLIWAALSSWGAIQLGEIVLELWVWWDLPLVASAALVLMGLITSLNILIVVWNNVKKRWDESED